MAKPSRAAKIFSKVDIMETQQDKLLSELSFENLTLRYEDELEMDELKESLSKITLSKAKEFGRAKKIKDLWVSRIVHKHDFIIVIFNDQEIKRVIRIYEVHGFDIMEEKELIIVYGHETIALYFLDGTYKDIYTR